VKTLDARLVGELTTPVEGEIVAFVQAMLGGREPLAVLFYGSSLRVPDASGLMDFYVVVERLGDWHGHGLAVLGNRVLPPNIGYFETEIGGVSLRAKYAVLTAAQFEARCGQRSLDSTIWARFCQPVRMVWVRDSGAADRVLALVRASVVRAAVWAACLGPERGEALAFWRDLFARTYHVELRVERVGRGVTIMTGREERFAAILGEAWDMAGVRWRREGGEVRPLVAGRQRRWAERRWGRVARRGRILNVLRLLKAAFTFEDGARYLFWKIERHTGVVLPLSGFEARHPLLMLPVLLPRLRRAFRVRRGDS